MLIGKAYVVGGFKNVPQLRRQQMSCTFGGVLFLHKAARETSLNFQSANRSERSSSHLQAECEPNWILLSAAEEAKLQECSVGQRAKTPHASRSQTEHN